MRIPSLISLRLVIGHCNDQFFLLSPLGAFDVVGNTHGDQIFALLDFPTLSGSFPALTSLSFVGVGCRRYSLPRISSLQRIPTTVSLTLINQCLTAIIRVFWGPNSPLLGTVTICPREYELEGISRSGGRSAFNASEQTSIQTAALLSRFEDWEENVADAEMFDPADILGTLKLSSNGQRFTP